MKALHGLVVLSVFVGGLAFAQTTRDKPAPLTANGFHGTISAAEKGNDYYSFTAGPGTVSVVVDIDPHDANINVELGLYDKVWQPLLSLKQVAYNNKAERVVKQLTLKSQQPVFMRLTRNQYGGEGTYAVRVEGAVKWQPAETSAARQLAVPSSGKLRLEMKDGTSKEFDLATVKAVSVQ